MFLSSLFLAILIDYLFISIPACDCNKSHFLITDIEAPLKHFNIPFQGSTCQLHSININDQKERYSPGIKAVKVQVPKPHCDGIHFMTDEKKRFDI